MYFEVCILELANEDRRWRPRSKGGRDLDRACRRTAAPEERLPLRAKDCTAELTTFKIPQENSILFPPEGFKAMDHKGGKVPRDVRGVHTGVRARPPSGRPGADVGGRRPRAFV